MKSDWIYIVKIFFDDQIYWDGKKANNGTKQSIKTYYYLIKFK